MQSTTIRVRRSTLEMLESYRRRVGARSLDEAIRLLLMSHRRALLDRYYGVDRGRVSRFLEGDRLEDRGP
ncbi:MAG: hypothetical protein DRJ56_06725 [Thermoprotei archaeon]|nr:MAG: hypothetical protein DRJ56_06725 [Thermoprotei archaeon]